MLNPTIYATAPVERFRGLAGLGAFPEDRPAPGGGGAGPPVSDRDAILAASGALRGLAMRPDPFPGCGRLPPASNPADPARARALCYQRSALIFMGFLAQDRYGAPGEVATAAIQRMQRALGVAADGAWGPATQAALERLVGFPIPVTRTKAAGGGAPGGGGGGGRREEVGPPAPGDDDRLGPVESAGLGVLGLALAAAAAYLIFGK